MIDSKKIILVEDDKKKIDDIKEFLDSTFDYDDLIYKESYQSGLKELLKEKYDLLLLDMSIPTWDRTPLETGGDYQKFGGYKVLKELIRRNRPTKTILITMFDDFGESDTSVSLEQLNNLLAEEFSENYLGAVYYSSRENKWKDNLKHFIDQYLLHENTDS